MLAVADSPAICMIHVFVCLSSGWFVFANQPHTSRAGPVIPVGPVTPGGRSCPSFRSSRPVRSGRLAASFLLRRARKQSLVPPLNLTQKPALYCCQRGRAAPFGVRRPGRTSRTGLPVATTRGGPCGVFHPLAFLVSHRPVCVSLLNDQHLICTLTRSLVTSQLFDQSHSYTGLPLRAFPLQPGEATG